MSLPSRFPARAVGFVASVVLLVACGDEGSVAPATSTTAGAGGAGGAGGGGGGEGGERNCWEDDASGWSVEAMDTSRLAGEGFHDPMLAPDGLTLYYVARANVTAPQRVFRATRSSRGAPFVGGESLGSWSGLDPISNPWVVGSQLFLNFDSGFGDFEIAASFFDGTAWGFPVLLDENVNDPNTYANSNPTLTVDARRLILQRGVEGELDIKLYEAVRAEGLVGEPFGPATLVELPGIGPDALLACPTLSPDGLRLLFATTHPIDISGGFPPGTVTVWYTERASADGAWQPPTHVEAFDDPTRQTCILAMSGDGCEAIVERFSIGSTRPPNYEILRR